jgi:hypothetical protein
MSGISLHGVSYPQTTRQSFSPTASLISKAASKKKEGSLPCAKSKAETVQPG